MQGARRAILAGEYTSYCDSIRTGWTQGSET